MVTAFQMTPARLAQRSAAGRASYQATLRRFILANPDDPDRAAQQLTGWMRLHAKMAKPAPKGVTRAYILKAAARIGLPYATSSGAGGE